MASPPRLCPAAGRLAGWLAHAFSPPFALPPVSFLPPSLPGSESFFWSCQLPLRLTVTVRCGRTNDAPIKSD